MNLSPSDWNMGGKNAVSPDNVVTLDDDRTAMSEVRDTRIVKPLRKTDLTSTQSEIPNTGSSKNSKRRNVFGRTLESNGSHGEDGKDTASTPVSLNSTKRDSVDESGPSPKHRRAKRNSDNKPADRLSLFGTAFGRTRKPPPRYSTYVFIEIPALICTDGPESNRSTDGGDDGTYEKGEKEKPASTFSRLYHIGDRKSSISKHDVEELSARQVALDRAASPADTPTKLSKEEKDRALLRKRTSGGETPKSPTPAPSSNGPGLIRGRSVIEQIGTPDFNGWLMKKGEHYNTWKNRYCILKGHNLYWMRSNNNAVRTNLSDLLLRAEADFYFRRPRSKATSTFLVTRSSPTRLSSLEATVSKWNTLMTRLICSIRPPNPSFENG